MTPSVHVLLGRPRSSMAEEKKSHGGQLVPMESLSRHLAP